MTADELREFEESVRVGAEKFGAPGALHLSRGNEAQLIEIFKSIRRSDYVFSTYRSHYHALLHGIPADWLRAEIMAGRSININSAEYRFFTSSIVGGCLPIATGVALAIKRRGGDEQVFCFIGDMASTTGMFHECTKYAEGWNLPIKFIVEDNGYSTNTPTDSVWNGDPVPYCGQEYVGHSVIKEYSYTREWPHSGFKL